MFFFFFKVFIIVGLNDLGLQLMTILTNNLPIIFWDDIFQIACLDQQSKNYLFYNI